ncbi:MAG: protein kinase [Myxococcales bacterium]|nr:protein kinase [Myxococcales bacterium]
MTEEFVDVEPDGPAPGDRVAGKYVLRRLLGQGGYGSVWEGENVDLGKKVAVKLIEPQHSTSAEVTARFRREARAAGALESDHIVQVYDVGTDPDVGLYLVMELLRGEDLRHKLDRTGRVDLEHAVDWAHQIALALAKAHAAGVVHRDLKPANVFLHEPEVDHDESPETVVKLVDFGVSKLLSSTEGEALTVAGRTVGTPQYMSPEQVLGHPSDPRGDLWGLGVLLFEMLAGTPPYPLRDTFRETAMAIAYDPPPDLIERAPTVPKEIATVVARALEKDPDARFPDGTAFAEALVAAWPRAFEGGRAARRAGARVSPTSRRRNQHLETLDDLEVVSSGPRSSPHSPRPAEGAPIRSVVSSVPRSESTTVPVAVEQTTRVVVRQNRAVWLVAAVILGSAAVIVVAILSAKPREKPRPSEVAAQVTVSTSEPEPSLSVAPPASAPASISVVPSASSARPAVVGKPKPGPSGTGKPDLKPESDFGSLGVSSSY